MREGAPSGSKLARNPIGAGVVALAASRETSIARVIDRPNRKRNGRAGDNQPLKGCDCVHRSYMFVRRLAMRDGPTTAPVSRREQDLEKLIRKAQEDPGVRELMEVYSRAEATLTQAQPYLRAVNGYIQWVSDRTSA